MSGVVYIYIYPFVFGASFSGLVSREAEDKRHFQRSISMKSGWQEHFLDVMDALPSMVRPSPLARAPSRLAVKGFGVRPAGVAMRTINDKRS